MKLKFLILFFFLGSFAEAKVTGKSIEYTSDTLTMKGYVAYDDSIQGKRPGVLVVHEWWGLNDYVRKRADMLAELGYVALALDMYGEGKLASHPQDAGKFAQEVMQNYPEMKQRFMAALDQLKKDPRVDTSKIAAIGYCFGGAVVLGMAREGVNLDAVASFHGSLATEHPAKKGAVKAKILVANGADDTFIPEEDIKNFRKEMKAAGADFEFKNYPGAIHGFTNPDATENGKKFNIAIAYDEKADKQSWADMQKLFRKAFR